MRWKEALDLIEIRGSWFQRKRQDCRKVIPMEFRCLIELLGKFFVSGLRGEGE